MNIPTLNEITVATDVKIYGVAIFKVFKIFLCPTTAPSKNSFPISLGTKPVTVNKTQAIPIVIIVPAKRMSTSLNENFSIINPLFQPYIDPFVADPHLEDLPIQLFHPHK